MQSAFNKLLHAVSNSIYLLPQTSKYRFNSHPEGVDPQDATQWTTGMAAQKDVQKDTEGDKQVRKAFNPMMSMSESNQGKHLEGTWSY
ncbi:hypothetical protein DSO57_1014137 [Entomophthora muscae]|uniref:Uncharacterized protein n=1 Tax=Entomophthora muscae TaxID=34485 RepID=A0ACC2S7A2_9FUNG|nr:hypothetical protein DSO57_1014137 [Entomophthora muscae]